MVIPGTKYNFSRSFFFLQMWYMVMGRKYKELLRVVREWGGEDTLQGVGVRFNLRDNGNMQSIVRQSINFLGARRWWRYLLDARLVLEPHCSSLTHSSSKAPRENYSTTSTTAHGYWFKHILLFSSVHKCRIINAEFGGRSYPPLRPSSCFASVNEQIAELPRDRDHWPLSREWLLSHSERPVALVTVTILSHLVHFQSSQLVSLLFLFLI
jgi:hypothetical protein